VQRAMDFAFILVFHKNVLVIQGRWLSGRLVGRVCLQHEMGGGARIVRELGVGF